MKKLLSYMHIKCIIEMGSRCCQQSVKTDDHQLYIVEKDTVMQKQISNSGLTLNQKVVDSPPELDSTIAKILQQKKPFQTELRQNQTKFQAKYYSNGEFYLGLLKNNEPLGLGKLYRKDGSLVIGYWQNGLVQGRVVYISKDELFCEGQVSEGKLNCQSGLLETKTIRYQGGFKDNLFDGKGLLSAAQITFNGIYQRGKRSKGKLTWISDGYLYEYEGLFDSQQSFTATGKLIEPFGVYQGQFVGGQKHGKGKYTYNSGLIYQGDYSQGKHSGRGTIINKDKTVAYEGQFHQGLPNGFGKSYKDGRVHQEGEFIQGVFKEHL